ncbi:MAG: hypothetical protein UH080_04080, partial [Ruminococcus sp.]|nr:hypothetical protein [Ruminococcus sp.]
ILIVNEPPCISCNQPVQGGFAFFSIDNIIRFLCRRVFFDVLVFGRKTPSTITIVLLFVAIF